MTIKLTIEQIEPYKYRILLPMGDDDRQAIYVTNLSYIFEKYGKKGVINMYKKLIKRIDADYPDVPIDWL